MKTVCLAILNYNGINHLEHLLPSVRPAVDGFGHPCACVVLDNQSTKNDAEWVAAHYPGVEFVRAPKNEFMYSYNWLAQQREEDILIFLNNDTRLTPDFIRPLVRHFERKDVFSVCAKSLSWDGAQATCGPARLHRRHGFFSWHYECDRQQLAHTLFSSSGFMAVDRKKFLALDGFCRLYYPMYCDDLDLSFRAWRKGWRSIYEPASVLYHRENGSGQSRWVQYNHERNALLFQWASLPLATGRWQRLPRMLKLMAFRVLHGDFAWFSLWFKTRSFWEKNQTQYAALKISEVELQTIIQGIDSPVA